METGFNVINVAAAAADDDDDDDDDDNDDDDMGVAMRVEWQFGSILCKTAPYIQQVAVSASINSLTAIAIER